MWRDWLGRGVAGCVVVWLVVFWYGSRVAAGVSGRGLAEDE